MMFQGKSDEEPLKWVSAAVFMQPSSYNGSPQQHLSLLMCRGFGD